jgi:hypothetical protein
MECGSAWQRFCATDRMKETIVHVVFIMWIGATWFLGGRRLLPRKLRNDEPFLIWASALGVAAGTTACVVTVLAALGALRSGPLWAIEAAWSVLTILTILEWRTGMRTPTSAQPRRRWPVVWLAALAAMAALTLVGTLAPPTSIDAMVYHLRIPRDYLRAGRIVPLADDVHSFQPLDVEMLFAFGMSLRDDVVAALLHWLLGVGAALSAGAWARRFGARSATAGIAVFAVSPLIGWESTSSFIDLGLSLFASLGILWTTRPDSGIAGTALAAVFVGLAAGSKFTGCGAVAVACGCAFLYGLPDRRRAVAHAAAIGVGAAAVASPWYIRNAFWTGDPIYPLANHFFGVAAPVERLSNWTYGYGRDLLHLVTSPFDLTWRGDPFDLGWSLGPAYLALAPLGILLGRRDKTHRIVGGILFAYWLFWFYSSPQTRLLLPILPMASGLISSAVDHFESDRWLRWTSRAVVATSVIVGLAAAALVARGSWRVVVGLESRTAFLRRTAADYSAFEQVDPFLGPQARLAVEGLPHVYYLNAPSTIVHAHDVASLAGQGFTHFLWIGSCDRETAGPGEVLWKGRFLEPGSRFQRAVAASMKCGTLTRLTQ